MKITILKGSAPRHDYFAQQIAAIKGVDSQIITFSRLDKKRLKKMIKKNPKTFISRTTKHLLQKIRKQDHIEKNFFGDYDLQQIIVENINGDFSYQKIKSFDPDLIVIFGTPIISNRILDVPEYGAINLHGGISPWYKGGNTIFWPLIKKDFDKIGATLHYAVKKVDSGKMLARVYPDINPNDTEINISNKTFKYATEELCNIIKFIENTRKVPTGKNQEEKGSLYMAKDRTLWKDLWGSQQIKRNIKDISIPKRIERFY